MADMYNIFGRRRTDSDVVSPLESADGVVAPAAGGVETPAESGGAPVGAVHGNGGVSMAGVPTKAQMLSNPVRTQEPEYVSRMKEQQAAQRTTYVPDKENKGRGVVNWIKGAFKKPETESGNRQQLQNIAALTDVLRNAANLWYTSKGATPQNIVNQTEVNKARWAQEDALAKAQYEKERKYNLDVAKTNNDLAYKNASLALRGESNDIAKGNLAINQGKYQMAVDEHPFTLAQKAAGIENTKANTERTRVETQLAPERFKETQRHNRDTERRGWAHLKLSREREARIAADGGGYSYGGRIGKKGSHLAVTPSGSRYSISKEFYANIENIYNRMRASAKNGKMPEARVSEKSFVGPDGKVVSSERSGKPTKMAMLDAIMQYADTKEGHANFVYLGKRYGYQYIDGMSKAKANELGVRQGYNGATV